MPMREEDILVLSEPTMGSLENIYLPAVFKGMGTTLRHMFKAVAPGGGRTIQYPEERRLGRPP
ncbi:MAG: hypothetical protein ACF8NJ_00385 [Phycisphaerales bacterium JB038]